MFRERFDRIDFWIGQTGGDPGGLQAGEIFRGDMEVGPGGGFDPIDAFSHFGDVKVHFEDSLFPPDQFDHKGEIDFKAFPEPAAPLPEENVLGHLLADGTGAMEGFAFLVMFHCLLDILEIESIVVGEKLVFGADDGQLCVRGDIFPVDIRPMEAIAAEEAAELGEGDRGIDPFQENDVDELQDEEEEKDAFDHSPDAGEESLGVRFCAFIRRCHLEI